MPKTWNTRRFKRIFYKSPVVVRIGRKHRQQVCFQKKNAAGSILDMSVGGCSVEVPFFIPKGTEVHVFIDRELFHVESSDFRPSGKSRIHAEVASCTTRGIRKYRLGLKFTKKSKSDHDLIAKFVEHHERRKETRVTL